MIEPPLQPQTSTTARVVRPAGARRYLTLMFADLSESTRLGTLMEPEDYAAMLDNLRELYRRVINLHGGHIARVQGDGVLAVFGVPQSREEDARRAVEAALQLHSEVAKIKPEGLAASYGTLALHTGVHGGLVYLADGDVERGRFELVGDVPNTASRLSGVAGRGEILASTESLGPELHFFKTDQHRLAEIKGRSQALAICRIIGRSAVRSRFQSSRARGLTPFAGRRAELDALRDHLHAAHAGIPVGITILGGPGVGKTRLAEQLAHDPAAQGFRVLRGYCEADLGAEPLQPFLQILRALCGIQPGVSKARAATLAAQMLAFTGESVRATLLQSMLPGHAGQRPVDSNATILAMGSLFDALAVHHPILFLIDDVQWADDSSQQMLAAILQSHSRVVVVCTSRITELDAMAVSSGNSILLEPLDLEDARDNIRHKLPGADPFMVAEIHRYSGGNPLFIEELCHALSASQVDQPLENRAGGAAWLNTLIESRFARLPSAHAQIVRVAAIIGNVVPLWLLQQVSGQALNAADLGELAAQDFLFPVADGDVLRFKHGITRDVVYASVALHERKAMHFQVAQALKEVAGQSESVDGHEALAYHYAACGQTDLAAHFAEMAGDKALGVSALDRARIQYLAALDALDQSPVLTPQLKVTWCEVAEKLGMACVFDPLALAQGLTIFERALDLATQTGDDGLIARAHYWLAYLCYAKGLAKRAAQHCEISLALAEQKGYSRLAAQVRATLAQVLTSAANYQGAARLYELALDDKRKHIRPGSAVAVGSAYTLSCQGLMLGDQGRFADAQTCFEEALNLLGDSKHSVGSSVRGWVAVVSMWQGRWEDALEVANFSCSIAEATRSRQLVATSRAQVGYSRWVLTGAPDSLNQILQATTWIEERNGRFTTSLNYGWLVDAYAELGDVAATRRYAARLFLRARDNEKIGEAMGCRALARLAANAGDFARAQHYLNLALKCAQVRNSPHEKAATQLYKAEIDIRRGSRGDARQALDEASLAFEKMQMLWHLDQAKVLQSRL
jgi:class 3 adenylate cyclase/tetratricopeptide (TPR) repeat protein